MVAGDKVRRPPAAFSGRLPTWKGSWRRTRRFTEQNGEARQLRPFTRVDTGAIRERGMIFSPALVVVADATLLDDPSSRVLEGPSAGFFNTITIGSMPCFNQFRR